MIRMLFMWILLEIQRQVFFLFNSKIVRKSDNLEGGYVDGEDEKDFEDVKRYIFRIIVLKVVFERF